MLNRVMREVELGRVTAIRGFQAPLFRRVADFHGDSVAAIHDVLLEVFPRKGSHSWVPRSHGTDAMAGWFRFAEHTRSTTPKP